MSLIVVLAPVFAEVALTLALGLALAFLRYRAVASGAVHARDIALRQPAWPQRITQVGNAFQNQLETPMLFYLVMVLALFSSYASRNLVVLAWVFVALRYLHALVHVTTNNVPRRFALFIAATVVLLGMWGLFAVDVIVAG